MATKISDSEMSSDLTRHTARADGSGGWTVSWLPGRTLTHSQAVRESSAEALDGSERKLLLSHLARAYPDVERLASHGWRSTTRRPASGSARPAGAASTTSRAQGGDCG
jgi:hypothetical protein